MSGFELGAARFSEVLRRTVRELLRAPNREALFARACRVAVDVGGFRLAWVGWREGDQLEPVARAGHDEAYVDQVAVSLSGQRADGPSGRAVQLGQAQYCDDFATDPRMEPWREAARRNGFASSAALPLRQGGEVVGMLAIYASEPRFFDGPRRGLMEELAEDISFTLDRLAEHERCERAEQRYRVLFEQASDGIFIADAVGRYVDVNEAGLRLLGYSREELLALSMGDLIAPAELAAHPLELASIPLRSASRYERRLRRRDGTYVAVEIAGTRVEGGLLMGIVRDVSERNRLVSELVAADRLASVGRFAAGIAHEINNPLSFVSANLAWLKQVLETRCDPAISPEVAETLADTLGGAERMARILEELKMFVRPRADVPRPVDLARALEAALHVVGHHLRATAQLRTELAEVPPVLVDQGRLEQVLLNLLVNASQAVAEVPGPREIEVHVGRAGQMGVVEVSDSGPGIAPEVAPRVFDPFFTTKPDGQGSGLGLAICRSLVQAWGGTISFAPREPRGTTFRIEVPLASPPA